MNLPFYLVKTALSLLADKKRKHFIDACNNPATIQKKLKEEILKANHYPFPEELTTYPDYAGKQDLTRESISFFETTSGSTGTKKEIPYTKSLLKSFENMFLLWAHDLIFHSELNLKSGKFFMSVSPQIGEVIKDDRKYLSAGLNLLLKPFLVSNPNEHKGKTTNDFFLKVSRDLLQARDLEVFSVWSPTYLLSLLDFIEKNRKVLNIGKTPIHELWPQLKLISCWTHAQAEKSARVLQDKFPHVLIQSKGLLLTEGPVTIPWSEAKGTIPLLTEAYFEFVNENEEILLLHELKVGSVYRVVMTQKNGFMRYDTKDLVKVNSFYFKTPVLEFIGRAESICDLAGEKISEIILNDLYRNIRSSIIFVPDFSQALPCYALYIEKENAVDNDWEEPLMRNFHYELARKLGQLKPLKIIKVANLNLSYLGFYQARGMVLGDIKEKMLMSNLNEAEDFRKWIEKESPSSR